MFRKKLNQAFSGKLHNIEIKRERLNNDQNKLDEEDDDENEPRKSYKDQKTLKKRKPVPSVMQNTKETKITSEITIIEEVRKLNEAYQLILCEQKRKLDVQNRRASSYTKSSQQ